MVKIGKGSIIVCLLIFSFPAFAAVTTFTATHTYVLGDDDSRNTARQKCLAEAKRKILEQVGVYLESQTEFVTSSRSKTSSSGNSPQASNEERQQLTEQINTVSAGIMKTEIVKEEFREVEGRLQITLTLKADLDPEDIQKQLAARRLDQSVRKQVVDQGQRLGLIEQQLSIMMKEMRSAASEQQPGSERQPNNHINSDKKYLVLLQERKYDQAVTEIRHAISTKGATANLRSLLAFAIIGLNHDVKAAEAEAREAVRLESQNAMAHFALGSVLSYTDDKDGAEAEFREAIRINPRDAFSHFMLGGYLKRKRQLNEARHEYQEYLQLASSDSSQEPYKMVARDGLADIERLQVGLPTSGREIFNGDRGRCHYCHGIDGDIRRIPANSAEQVKRLNPRPSDLRNASSLKLTSDEQRFKIIKNGLPRTAMIAFKDMLTDSEIEAVLTYLAELRNNKN